MEIVVASTLSVLEEVLYIERELTPTSRDWRDDLCAFGHTEFDYHNCEFVRVMVLGGDRFGLIDLHR